MADNAIVMKNITDDINIPKSFGYLLKYIEENSEQYEAPYERAWKTVSSLNDLSPSILNSYFDYEEPDFDYYPELNYNIPFELVPFSYTGIDGMNYSWIVHAPELDFEEYPCVLYNPYDQKVKWIGDNSDQAIVSILFGLPDDWKKINIDAKIKSSKNQKKIELLKSLNIDIQKYYQYFVNKNDFDVHLKIPHNWRYEKTSDGIGVLAKKEFFGNYENHSSDIDSCLELSRTALNEEYPASALVFLKSIWYDSPFNLEIIELMEKAYEQLGRSFQINRMKLWKTKHLL
ncbi:hypothetical protein [Spirochaeta cellobiosiphila]|uniref:hypothetical protein n=1 Tax=Spirochaeta cellobiosiphila TaxID=504483 RepID=UPI00040E6CFE|nr:hypothetical protein [Spirochaeta cellobiosiphila]